jgi:hypothetical protein
MVLGHRKKGGGEHSFKDNILVNHFPISLEKAIHALTNCGGIAEADASFTFKHQDACRRKSNNNLVLHRSGTVCTYIQPHYARHLKIIIQQETCGHVFPITSYII